MCFCFNKEEKKGRKTRLMYQNWVKNRHRKADIKSCQQIPKFSAHFPKCEAAKTQQREKKYCTEGWELLFRAACLTPQSCAGTVRKITTELTLGGAAKTQQRWGRGRAAAKSRNNDMASGTESGTKGGIFGVEYKNLLTDRAGTWTKGSGASAQGIFRRIFQV